MSGPNSESGVYRSLEAGLAGRWAHYQRHEDAFSTGIPDYSFCSNAKHMWMEVKFRRELPKRDATPLRFEHYTPFQQSWLFSRAAACGGVAICVCVESHLLLFRGIQAYQVGHENAAWHFDNSVYHQSYKQRIDWDLFASL
jgi:hypothetical protein